MLIFFKFPRAFSLLKMVLFTESVGSLQLKFHCVNKHM